MPIQGLSSEGMGDYSRPEDLGLSPGELLENTLSEQKKAKEELIERITGNLLKGKPTSDTLSDLGKTVDSLISSSKEELHLDVANDPKIQRAMSEGNIKPSDIDMHLNSWETTLQLKFVQAIQAKFAPPKKASTPMHLVPTKPAKKVTPPTAHKASLKPGISQDNVVTKRYTAPTPPVQQKSAAPTGAAGAGTSQKASLDLGKTKGQAPAKKKNDWGWGEEKKLGIFSKAGSGINFLQDVANILKKGGPMAVAEAYQFCQNNMGSMGGSKSSSHAAVSAPSKVTPTGPGNTPTPIPTPQVTSGSQNPGSLMSLTEETQSLLNYSEGTGTSTTYPVATLIKQAATEFGNDVANYQEGNMSYADLQKAHDTIYGTSSKQVSQAYIAWVAGGKSGTAPPQFNQDTQGTLVQSIIQMIGDPSGSAPAPVSDPTNPSGDDYKNIAFDNTGTAASPSTDYINHIKRLVGQMQASTPADSTTPLADPSDVNMPQNPAFKNLADADGLWPPGSDPTKATMQDPLTVKKTLNATGQIPVTSGNVYMVSVYVKGGGTGGTQSVYPGSVNLTGAVQQDPTYSPPYSASGKVQSQSFPAQSNEIDHPGWTRRTFWVKATNSGNMGVSLAGGSGPPPTQFAGLSVTNMTDSTNPGGSCDPYQASTENSQNPAISTQAMWISNQVLPPIGTTGSQDVGRYPEAKAPTYSGYQGAPVTSPPANDNFLDGNVSIHPNIPPATGSTPAGHPYYTYDPTQVQMNQGPNGMHSLTMQPSGTFTTNGMVPCPVPTADESFTYSVQVVVPPGATDLQIKIGGTVCNDANKLNYDPPEVTISNTTSHPELQTVTIPIDTKTMFGDEADMAGAMWRPSVSITNSGGQPVTVYNNKLTPSNQASAAAIWKIVNSVNPYNPSNNFDNTQQPRSGAATWQSGDWGIATSGNTMFAPGSPSTRYVQAVPDSSSGANDGYIQLNSHNIANPPQHANGGIQSTKMIKAGENFNISMNFTAKSETPGYYPTLAMWTYGEVQGGPGDAYYHQGGPGADTITEFDEEMGSDDSDMVTPQNPAGPNGTVNARDGNYVGSAFGGHNEILNNDPTTKGPSWPHVPSFWNGQPTTLGLQGQYQPNGDLIITRTIEQGGKTVTWSQVNVGKGPFNDQYIKIGLENPNWNQTGLISGNASVQIHSLSVTQTPPPAGVNPPTIPRSELDHTWFNPSGGGGAFAYTTFPTKPYPWTAIPPTNMATVQDDVNQWLASAHPPPAIAQDLQKQLTSIMALKGTNVADTEQVQETALRAWTTLVVNKSAGQASTDYDTMTSGANSKYDLVNFNTITMMSVTPMPAVSLAPADVVTIANYLLTDVVAPTPNKKDVSKDISNIKELQTVAQTAVTNNDTFYQFAAAASKDTNLNGSMTNDTIASSGIIHALTGGFVPNNGPPLPATQPKTLGDVKAAMASWLSYEQAKEPQPAPDDYVLYFALQKEVTFLETPVSEGGMGLTDSSGLGQLQYWAYMEKQGLNVGDKTSTPPTNHAWKDDVDDRAFLSAITNTSVYTPPNLPMSTSVSDLQGYVRNILSGLGVQFNTSTVPPTVTTSEQDMGHDGKAIYMVWLATVKDTSASTLQDIANYLVDQWNSQAKNPDVAIKGNFSGADSIAKGLITSLTGGAIPVGGGSSWPPAAPVTSWSEAQQEFNTWANQPNCPTELVTAAQEEMTNIEAYPGASGNPQLQFQMFQAWGYAVSQGYVPGVTIPAGNNNFGNFLLSTGATKGNVLAISMDPTDAETEIDFMLTLGLPSSDTNFLNAVMAYAKSDTSAGQFEQDLLNNWDQLGPLYNSASSMVQQLVAGMANGLIPPGSKPSSSYTPPSSPPTTISGALADAKELQNAYNAANESNHWADTLVAALENYPSGASLSALQGLGALFEQAGAGGPPIGGESFTQIFQTITNTGGSPKYPVNQGSAYAAQVLDLYADSMPSELINSQDRALLKTAVTSLQGGASIQSVLSTLSASWSEGGLYPIQSFLTSEEGSGPAPYTPPSSPPTTVGGALADAKAWQTAYDAANPQGNSWINSLVSALENYPAGASLNVLQGLGALFEQAGAGGASIGGESFKQIFETITNTGGSPQYPVKQGAAYAAQVLSLYANSMPSSLINSQDLALLKTAVTSLQGGASIQSVLSTLSASWSEGGLYPIQNFLTSEEAGAPKPAVWPPTSPPTTLADTKADMDYLAYLHPGNVWLKALDQAIDNMPPGTNLASFQAYANILLNEGAAAGADEGIFKTIVNAGAAPGGQGEAFAAGVLQMMSKYPPLGIFPAQQFNAITAASQSLASGMPISQVISNLQAAWGSRGGLTAIVNFLHSAEGGPPKPAVWPPTSPPTTLADAKADMDYLASLHPGNVWLKALDQAIDNMPPNTNLASFQAYANILLNEGASAGADESIFKTIINAGAAPGGQGEAFAAGVLQMMSKYPPLGIFPAQQFNAITAASQSLASGMPISQVISNLQAAWGSRGGLTAIVNFLNSVSPSA